jgi:hypothetical protein
MLRTAAKKVAWVGRTASMVLGLALVLALLFGLASMAFAANGGNFVLGVLNQATAVTKLSGNVPGGPALEVINNKTDAGSRGLQVNVAEGKAPILVNSTAGKATNLNADKVDGTEAATLLPGGSLPRGRTVRGAYVIRFTPEVAGDTASESISFGYTLASEPTSHFIPVGTTPPSGCPGSASNPRANPGFFCIYEVSNAGTTGTVICNPISATCGIPASRYGGYLRTDSTGTSSGTRTLGTWAVTGS